MRVNSTRFSLALLLFIPIGVAAQSVLIADTYPGSDIGAKINNAVAACPVSSQVNGPQACTIQVNRSGTISTDPELPAGFSLVFNPAGTYSLNTNWVLDHHGVSIFGNSARFLYTKPSSDSGYALYVGKNLVSVVNASRTSVTWISGAQFSRYDAGDQVELKGADGRYEISNIAAVTPVSLTLSPALANTYETATMSGIMATGINTGATSFDAQSVLIRDMNIAAVTGSEGDTALTLESLGGAHVDNFKAMHFTSGTCLRLNAVIASIFVDLGCSEDGSGEVFDVNHLGGMPAFSGSNSNKFVADTIEGSRSSAGIAIDVIQGWGNHHDGLDMEGNHNDRVIYDHGTMQGLGANLYRFSDYEWNGTGRGFEINIETNNDVLDGPSQIQSGTSPLIAVGGPDKNVSGVELRDLQINAPRSEEAYRFWGTSTGYVRNVQVLKGNAVPGLATVEDSGGNYTTHGTIGAGGGAIMVYRCTSAGTLPTGALTTNPSGCGTSVDTGLRTK
jgi:hypothetical protein